jgi:excisionase family DNA binding protein
MINPDRIYNTREAQAAINKAAKRNGWLGVTRERVTQMCAEGEIVAVKVGGRYLIRGDRLRDYMLRMGLEVDHG